MADEMRVKFINKDSSDEYEQLMALGIPFLIEAIQEVGKATGLGLRSVLACTMSAAAAVAEAEGCREELAQVLERWVLALRSDKPIRLAVKGSA